MPFDKTNEYLTTPAFNFRLNGKPVGPMYIRHHVVVIPRSIHRQGSQTIEQYLIRASRAWAIQELLNELDACCFDKTDKRVKDNYLATPEFFESFPITSRADFDALLLNDTLDVAVLSIHHAEIEARLVAAELIENKLTEEERNDPLTTPKDREYLNRIAHLADSFDPSKDGGMLDTLIALVEAGPLFDGDVPSKAGRADLIDLGLAKYVMHKGQDGYAAATYTGRDVYLYLYGKASTVAEGKANRIAGRTIRSAMLRSQ